ncbi:odorant receptor 4-like [Aricia agestis]|uniref:odorant receptor 4-like n=1 Tax=Aricia agestis TaxID=91739 RepID=UPI001C20711E|nr:odorant receptor 4-like [Aricia agestis]
MRDDLAKVLFNIPLTVQRYPKIISSWFPFDVTKKPGYFVSVVTHVVMIVQGGGIIASYDTTVFVIMSFLKGQLIILKTKCTEIFGDETAIPRSEVLKNIKECHRLHNFLTEQYRMFNQLISPVMFIYVLICSVMICCCVVQLNLDGVTVSEKFWILEYMIAAGVQLFIFCWHSNDITYESSLVDRGIFDSNWWRADPKLRTHLTLLSGKLAIMYRIRAGPFTTLSMPTFTEILRGAYSFYTLFTKSTNK